MIGTALCAAEHSEVSPCIIFCNPIKSLATIARCRDFLFQPLIESISVPVGPMVLSGSTRLQATSALMFVVGGALSKALGLTIDTRELLSEMILFLEAPQYRDLIPWIIKESQWTKNRHPVHYHCTSFALILLNDTTERAPTFNMRPFENASELSHAPSDVYLFYPNNYSTSDAWKSLLRRRQKIRLLKRHPLRTPRLQPAAPINATVETPSTLNCARETLWRHTRRRYAI